MRIYLFLYFFFWVSIRGLFAQEIQEITVNIVHLPVSLGDVFQQLEKRHPIKFFYKKEWIESISIYQPVKNQSLYSFLNEYLPPRELNYVIFQDHYLILLKNNETEEKKDSLLTKEKTSTQDSIFSPGQSFTLSGTIREANTGESIMGATIQVVELDQSTASNTLGYFSLTLPPGLYTFHIRAIGRQNESIRVLLNRNQTLTIDLFEKSTQLSEIIISAESDRNINSTEIGVKKLDIQAIQNIPSFFGEMDIIRSLTTMPGVSTVGEGATGFNVRGGSVDQNLVLFDDAPIFNTSHLFGFFSVFNQDVIKDLTLYTGGIPAQYGGRVSSILDVKSRDGNSKKITVKGGTGLISSRLMVEGPFVKNKLSFLVAGRIAYPNWLLKRVPNITVRNSSAGFYDLNAKLSFNPNARNKFSLSYYLNHDAFRVGKDTTYRWGTQNLTMKWAKQIGEKLIVNLTGIAGDYRYEVEGKFFPNFFELQSGIFYRHLKLDASYFPHPKHKIDLGVSFFAYRFRQGELKPTREESSILPSSLENENSREWAVYYQQEFKWNARISFAWGLRYSWFRYLGQGSIFVYQEGLSRRESRIIDTLYYDNAHLIQSYQGWEPRFSVKLNVSPQSSVKMGYNRTYQYLHLISNTTALSPLDVWKSSDPFLPPQIGDHWTVGYFNNLKKNQVEISVELYYKFLQNLIDYKEGATLLLNPALEADLLTGSGKAYGIEWMLRKNYGKLTGWINYAFTRSWRKVNGSSPEERINQGKFYPSNFDKPHTFNLLMNYALTKRVSFSCAFTYSTGRPVSIPESVYFLDASAVSSFSSRNQYRIPDYHRLDISLQIEGNHKVNVKYKSSWNFGVYNLYARRNPYSIFFQQAFGGKLLQANRLAVLGTIFPTITYNFQF